MHSASENSARKRGLNCVRLMANNVIVLFDRKRPERMIVHGHAEKI